MCVTFDTVFHFDVLFGCIDWIKQRDPPHGAENSGSCSNSNAIFVYFNLFAHSVCLPLVTDSGAGC